MDCIGRLVLVICGRRSVFFGLYVCGWCFQSLWTAKGEGDGICGYWILGVDGFAGGGGSLLDLLGSFFSLMGCLSANKV